MTFRSPALTIALDHAITARGKGGGHLTHVVAVALFGALSIASPATFRAAAAQTQPVEFGFRIVVKHCLAETFDSFTGVFTKELGGEGFPRPSVTTRLTLTSPQME